MEEPRSPVAMVTDPDSRGRMRGAIFLIVSASLIASAVVYVGYHAWIAFDPDDTNHLETPLALAVARQLVDGPSTLYGPFSGSDPLVLIHAPLYYRLAALGAWPIAWIGVSPISSALIAGRALSFVGMLLLVISAGRIASRDGAGWISGAWAALLIATSPVFGSFAFTVRPDTLGVALQTIGLGLVLRAIGPRRGADSESRSSRWCLPVAGIAFGLAVCVKQHLIVSAIIAIVLLLSDLAAIRRRVGRGLVVASLLLGVIVPTAYYGWEQFVTGGRMWESVFVLPSQLRELVPASWSHVQRVFFEVAKLAIGLIAIAISLILVSPRRAILGTRLDGAVGLVLVAEVAAMVPLCLGSEGAWVNYAMPAVVWASILVARAAVRVLDAPKLKVRSMAIGLAALLLFANDVRLAERSYSLRKDGRELLAQVLADPTVAGTPRTRRYFVAQPQFNRLFGRVDLAHDEWLYASYEATNRAEPRSRWLLAALTGRPTRPGDPSPDPVTLVVVPSETNRRGEFVHGLVPTLPHLGYKNFQQYGKYALWIRTPKP